MMVLCQPVYMKKINTDLNITIGNTIVESAPSVRNIGAVLDSGLRMNEHINYICRTCYINLRSLNQIRPYLTEESVITLVHAFVTCRLDNLNSLLVGVPDYQLQRLQLIQNYAARIIKRTSKYDSITNVLIDLHWLPVKARIDYKVLLLTYKSINDLGPSYLAELLNLKIYPRETRSSMDALQLEQPLMRLKTVGDRAFSAYAPVIWNQLPLSLRTQTTLASYGKHLKTHLFRKHYNIDTDDIQDE